MAKRVASMFARPRRAAVLGVALLFASSAAVATTFTGVAHATSATRPVEVTFDNRSSQDIAACVFGSGGRCTNGGITAGAIGVVADPFNSNQKVKITVFETGTATPGSFSRTVTAKKQLCATVTEDHDGSLKFHVKSGTC